MKRRKAVYVSAPLGAKSKAEIEANIRQASAYAKYVASLGFLPICPHLLFSFTDDTVPEERELALNLCIDLLRLCDELWQFGGKETNGMTLERLFWQRLFPRKPINALDSIV